MARLGTGRSTRPVSHGLLPSEAASQIDSLAMELKPVILDGVTNDDKQPDHTSFSQLNMYLRCSMQYYFRYVLGKKERPKLTMARGKAGHEAVELNAVHKMATKEDQTTEQILDNFSTAWDRELSEFTPKDFDPGEVPGKEKDNTAEALRLYRGKVAINETPEAVELEFLVPIPQSEEHQEAVKPVAGRIDIINRVKRVIVPGAKAVERTEVKDRKFPSRLPSNQQNTADMSDQLSLYDLVMTAAGKPTNDLGFQHFVPPTKTIGPRIIDVYRSPQLMLPKPRAARHERIIYKLRTAARGIRKGIFLPQDDPRVCNNCGFRDICQFSLAKKDYDYLQLRSRDT